MANLLWGKVYYQDQFAGILREEPGDRTSFKYELSYIEAGQPPIAHTLPLQDGSHIGQSGLLPFFDNLVSEGWLEQAQTRLLGKRQVSRFELLLAFGYDCAGAVSVIDPEPALLTEKLLDLSDPKEMAVLAGRASLSGVQPKLAVMHKNGKYVPAGAGEVSTYIAKFPSNDHDDLVMNEYLTSLAYAELLPDDEIIQLSIENVDGFSEPALLIKRFDRLPNGGRIHFEEFNQLLNRKSLAKYSGDHKEMSEFIRANRNCLPIDNYRLFSRIIAGLLLGNTDMHFKNFAMIYTPQGLRLSPSYDQVAAQLYQYKSIALGLCRVPDMLITNLKAKHLVGLGEEFGLATDVIEMAFKQLNGRKERAQDAIAKADLVNPKMKDQLTKLVETQWNRTFALIGKALLKKR